MIIREFGPADIPQLWAMENEIWTNDNAPNLNSEKTLADYEKEMVGQQLLVAEIDQSVVGFINYHPPTPMKAHQKQWMIGIGIAKTAQGKGVGKKLITALLARARTAGIKKISLRVMASNPQAIAFYQHLGFQQEGYFKNEFWLNQQWVDDLQFAYYLD